MKFAPSTLFSALTLAVAPKMIAAGGFNRLRGPDLMSFLDAGARQLQEVTECGCPANSDDVKILAPRKTSDKILPDGFYSDWNLDSDFLANTSEAGKPDTDSNYELAGRVYARYDADINLLCMLVLSKDDTLTFLDQNDNMWFKYAASKSPVVPAEGTTIAYIDPAKPENAGRSGWEGCFKIAADCHTEAEIHQNYLRPGETGGGRTASTGKTNTAGKFSLCLTGTPCSGNSDCTTACTAGSCTDGYCSGMTSIGDSNCCVDEGDCVKKECQTESCTNNGCIYKAITTGECGGPDSGAECAVDDLANCEVRECQTATGCDEGICVYQNEDDEVNCTPENYAPVDDCDMGKMCNSGQCLNQYKPTDESCVRDDSWWTNNLEGNQVKICHQTTCQKVDDTSTKTTCQKSVLPDHVGYSKVCKGGPESVNVATRGDSGCDLGDRCEGGECKSLADYSYKQEPCRVSAGCCDIAEMCGADFFCPADLKHGDTVVCRDVCDDCEGDESEMCDGASNHCKADLILKEELCIMAGQHYSAGKVVVEAVFKDGSIDFQVEAQLEGSWKQSGSDPVKYFFSSTGQLPLSSPGQYAHKGKFDGFDIYESPKETVDVCVEDGDGAMITFAMHLDVTHSEYGGQTAWAMPCSVEEGASPTNTALNRQRFMNKKGKYQGWGKYITYKPCCPTDNCSGECAVPIPTPSPGPDPSSPAPGSTYDCACSCNEDGTVADAARCSSPTRRARALFPFA